MRAALHEASDVFMRRTATIVQSVFFANNVPNIFDDVELNRQTFLLFLIASFSVGFCVPSVCRACAVLPLLSAHLPTGSPSAVAGVDPAESVYKVPESLASNHSWRPAMLEGENAPLGVVGLAGDNPIDICTEPLLVQIDYCGRGGRCAADM